MMRVYTDEVVTAGRHVSGDTGYGTRSGLRWVVVYLPSDADRHVHPGLVMARIIAAKLQWVSHHGRGERVVERLGRAGAHVARPRQGHAVKQVHRHHRHPCTHDTWHQLQLMVDRATVQDGKVILLSRYEARPRRFDAVVIQRNHDTVDRLPCL